MAGARAYSMGIEEEYFIFDSATGAAVSRGSAPFIAQAMERLGDGVMPEMLQSQIEVATPPCNTADEARRHLAHFRCELAAQAKAHGLGIAALGTFPLAYWRAQAPTAKQRYVTMTEDLQMLALRNMLCGMHVHVAVSRPDARMGVIQRVVPHLPLLLALSTSSPFWEGHPTGLHGYRLAAYDELPRTGLPELLRTDAEFDEYVAALVDAGVIADSSHIWWAIRPSGKHPTVELRVCDSCPRLDDAVAIATLFRAMVRTYDRAPGTAEPPDRIGRAIILENKWRAQRYGVWATFVDPYTRRPVTASEQLEGLIAAVDDGEAEDTAAFDRLRSIVCDGSGADRLIEVYQSAIEKDASTQNALRAVVDWAAETTAG